MPAFGLPNLFRPLATAWLQGATAFAGPSTVILLTYGTSFGSVAALQIAFQTAPFGAATHLVSLLLTLATGPLLVTRGWLRKDRGPTASMDPG